MEIDVVICEDDKREANNLIKMIAKAEMIIEDNLNLQIVINAQSYNEVQYYIEHNEIEGGIYFLDIELSKEINKKNGIDVAELVKKVDRNAQIVFITTFDNYAPLTFEKRIGAIDYINKENSIDYIQERITTSVEIAINNIRLATEKRQHMFLYKIGRKTVKVSIDKIMYIQTTNSQHRLVLVTKQEQVVFTGNISTIQKEYNLLQISQSCLVNPNKISQMDEEKENIILENGKELHYSQRMKKCVKAAFLNVG